MLQGGPAPLGLGRSRAGHRRWARGFGWATSAWCDTAGPPALLRSRGWVGCCHHLLGQGSSGPQGQSWDGGPLGWGFAPQATEDQIKLLRLQRHLQEDFDKPYLDLSLHDTVSNLILDGQHKRAEQLYREFKIPDKRSVLGWGGLTPGSSRAVGLGSGGCRVLAAGGTGLTPVPRYWWLKISALANRGDWEEMEKFSKSKKSPIGYLV